MKPYDFAYIRATSVDHVISLFEEYGDDAKILAGGQSLLATLGMRLSAPDILIDINELQELSGISVSEGKLTVGALTRHAAIQKSDDVAQHLPLLKSAIDHVAHAAIRNRGTHGGSIVFADPAAEIPACVVALNATLVLLSGTGERRVPAREFFLDLYETQLQENEILVAIEYPVADADTVSAFREFSRRKGDFATVGLALNAQKSGDTLSDLALVFFGVANTPVMATDTARHLTGQTLTPELVEAAQGALADELEVIGDMYVSTDMKLHLAKYFLKQVIDELMV